MPSPDPARQAMRDQLAMRLQEPSRADERLLPVAEAFAGLLPGRGIRRGSVTAVTGSYALALALVAEAGTWIAAVGLDDLGIVAAYELGLGLERLTWIPYPGRLRARQALVNVTGRGAAANGHRAWLWLPDDQGRIRPMTLGDHRPV